MTRRELRGTVDDLARRLDVAPTDLTAAVDELGAIGWVMVERLAGQVLVLRLPEDLRFSA